MKKIINENYVQEQLDLLRKEKGAEDAEIKYAMEFCGVKFAEIPLVLINIDESYQRTENFSLSRAINIKNNFRPEACGAISVNYRNGKYYASDGMHRIMAKILKGEDSIVCSLTAKTFEEEVINFVEQAKYSRRPSAYDRLKAKAAIGMYPAREIINTCRIHGLEPAPNIRKNLTHKIHCISYIERLTESFGVSHLDDLLDFVVKAGYAEQPGGLAHCYLSVFSQTIRKIEKENPEQKMEILDAIAEELKNIPPIILSSKAISKYDRCQKPTAMLKYLKDMTEELDELKREEDF